MIPFSSMILGQPVVGLNLQSKLTVSQDQISVNLKLLNSMKSHVLASLKLNAEDFVLKAALTLLKSVSALVKNSIMVSLIMNLVQPVVVLNLQSK